MNIPLAPTWCDALENSGGEGSRSRSHPTLGCSSAVKWNLYHMSTKEVGIYQGGCCALLCWQSRFDTCHPHCAEMFQCLVHSSLKSPRQLSLPATSAPLPHPLTALRSHSELPFMQIAYTCGFEEVANSISSYSPRRCEYLLNHPQCLTQIWSVNAEQVSHFLICILCLKSRIWHKVSVETLPVRLFALIVHGWKFGEEKGHHLES